MQNAKQNKRKTTQNNYHKNKNTHTVQKAENYEIA